MGGDVRRTESPLGVLITLEPATKPMMIQEAKAARQYLIRTWAQTYDSITIVTAQEIGEGLKRLEPMSIEVLKAAQRSLDSEQLSLSLTSRFMCQRKKGLFTFIAVQFPAAEIP